MRATAGSVTVEKLMALSACEYRASLQAFLKDGADAVTPDPECVRLQLESGSVTITYSPRPAVLLGGLLAMPRALVTLAFDGVDAPARDRFLRRFDLAFQRGGG